MTQNQPEPSACPSAATRPHLGVMRRNDTPKARSWRPAHSFTSLLLPSQRGKAPLHTSRTVETEAVSHANVWNTSKCPFCSLAVHEVPAAVWFRKQPTLINHRVLIMTPDIFLKMSSVIGSFSVSPCLFAICKLARQRRLFSPQFRKPVGLIWLYYDVTQTGVHRGEWTDQ